MYACIVPREEPEGKTDKRDRGRKGLKRDEGRGKKKESSGETKKQRRNLFGVCGTNARLV